MVSPGPDPPTVRPVTPQPGDASCAPGQGLLPITSSGQLVPAQGVTPNAFTVAMLM